MSASVTQDGHNQVGDQITQIHAENATNTVCVGGCRDGSDFTFASPADLGDRLAEVDVNSSLVNQDVVHLEIGVLTCGRLTSTNLA